MADHVRPDVGFHLLFPDHQLGGLAFLNLELDVKLTGGFAIVIGLKIEYGRVLAGYNAVNLANQVLIVSAQANQGYVGLSVLF